MGLILFIFALLIFSVISSAKLSIEEDVNSYLFSKNRNFEFVDLTHDPTVTINEQFALFSSEICVKPRLNESVSNVWTRSQARGKVVGNIPLDNLILPLIIVDISDKAMNDDSNFVLQKYHLDYMLNNFFGRTYQPCLVVFKFGWTKNYVENKYNLNNFYIVEEHKEINYPGISEDVARWVTKSYKNVVGVGVDTPSVDPAPSRGSSAFSVFADAGVYVLSNIKLDQYLPEASCTAVVSPMKTGEICSPYRLMVICPKSRMKPREFRLHRL